VTVEDNRLGKAEEICGHERKLRILAVGFLPPPLGGVSVSFKVFCDIVSKRDDVRLTVINVSGMNQRKRLLQESSGLLVRLWHNIKRTDVVTLHCSTEQVATLASAIWILCRLQRKSFVLRMGAGLDHREYGVISGRVAEFVSRRVELFLVQTQRLLEACRRRGYSQVDWYPTSRVAGRPKVSRPKCQRFVFVGHVRLSKGVEELIEAAEGLSESAHVDVYGQCYDGLDESTFASCHRICYRGVLDFGKVIDVLREYDAFVLPSKASTEGYPGAILEALSVGLPVISTTVGGIPEIVDRRCGILVEPGDVETLAEAMNELVDDEALYHRLCKGALAVGDRFSAERWADWFVGQCCELKDSKLGR
jgi:glycosyltransferase involved in cell wall biosynthesis